MAVTEVLTGFDWNDEFAEMGLFHRFMLVAALYQLQTIDLPWFPVKFPHYTSKDSFNAAPDEEGLKNGTIIIKSKEIKILS